MGTKYLMDSNVIIDYLDNKLPDAGMFLCDAIIAATAIFHNFTLLTRNVDDFRTISSLQFINPWEI